jgi:hypothetical protein
LEKIEPEGNMFAVFRRREIDYTFLLFPPVLKLGYQNGNPHSGYCLVLNMLSYQHDFICYLWTSGLVPESNAGIFPAVIPPARTLEVPVITLILQMERPELKVNIT